jgi:hypothetical protein
MPSKALRVHIRRAFVLLGPPAHLSSAAADAFRGPSSEDLNETTCRGNASAGAAEALSALALEKIAQKVVRTQSRKVVKFPNSDCSGCVGISNAICVYSAHIYK